MIIRQGTSIIEIVIAAALISIAMIAALSLMNHSQKQNTYARDLAEATKYVTQVAEWLRTERNNLGWATMAAKVNTDGSGATYCLNTIPSTSTPEYSDFTDLLAQTCAERDYIPATVENTFQRQISVVSDTPGKLIITISVNWPWTSTTTHQATIEMELSQW